ncbi:hypothetical protein ONS95_004914 [Cadophora gregata]|uniref:uncharacterized protein n=1 Tax=Cadophora gregata TaxID=51156 RepID=UPI0026DD338C|nr:uncharacterized protein ONS95_004914 [Cadophora gregata]KAK0104633.1 hypothetical protein ONS95_004914 [Cadophora gregata]
MHLQTGGSTTTTMAYSAIPLPASPTLTNPDMILPYGEYDSTPSPPRRKYRSEAAGGDWDENGQTDMHFSIGPPHAHMGLMTPTTPIIYGNGTMLSDIGEVTEAESTPGRSKLPGPAERRLLKKQQLQQASGSNTPLGSSPTIGYAAVMKRAKTGTHQRKISVESTSTVTSEGQAAELFKDFDDGVSVDDSVFQGDDEESVADSYSEQVIASETQRLATTNHSVGQDDDRNSSAALSRRAEQILLNAKKRLNNMEGNLTRARSSLYTIPSGSLSSIHSSSPLSRSTPSPHDETMVTALGVPPSKIRQLHTPRESPAASPRHARVGSENSALSPQRVAPFPIPFPVRSASAAARYVRNDGSKRSPPFVKAPETPREDARVSSHPGLSSSLNRNSPPHALLEPLGENDVPDFEADRASTRSSVDGYLTPNGEHRGLTRSASSMQMRDLKDQMSDLKGRLSVLRDRARDDTMKRRSLQSLRTPSPFTAAEQWYATSKNYGEPLSADAGIASSPWKGSLNGDEAKQEEIVHALTTDTPQYAESDVTSVYEDVNEHSYAVEVDANNHEPGIPEEDEAAVPAEESQKDEPVDEYEDDYSEDMVDHEEADEYESDASLYHDSLTTPISHEDREDAFDYEHFFLHSAMGTISQQRMERRGSTGSFSSEGSVETVQGPSISSTKSPARASLGHFRSESTDSVSTVATFETATEGNGSENGDEDERRDTFAVQQVGTLSTPRSNTATPLTAKRSTFGSDVKNYQPVDRQASPDRPRRPSSTGHDQTERNGNNVHRPSIGSFESFGSNGTTRSFPLVNKPKTQQHTASTPDFRASKEIEPSLLSDSMTLTDGMNGERLQPSPVHMLAREDQILVERLVASLGKCVLGLQESGRASYDGRVFRRRLDAARRVLEGDQEPV